MFTQLQFLAAQQLLKKLYETCCEPLFQKYHLTRMELDVLMLLSEEDGIETAGELVAQLGFTKSHVSKAVEELVHRGWVLAQTDKEDRRRIRLRVSVEAQQVVQEGRSAQRKLAKFLYQGMSEQEQKQFDGYLVRAIEAAQRALDGQEKGESHGTA